MTALSLSSSQAQRVYVAQALAVGLLVGAAISLILALWGSPYSLPAAQFEALPAARQTLMLNTYWNSKIYTFILTGLVVGLVVGRWRYESINAHARPVLRGLWRSLWRNKVGFTGFLGVLGFVFLMFVLTAITDEDVRGSAANARQPPSAEHWLGTDHQGRDVWTQIIHGGRELVVTALAASFISTSIAVVFGTLGALVGGVVDTLIVVLTNFVLTVPRLPLLIIIATLVSFDHVIFLALVVGLLGWPGLLRAIRAQVLSLRERDYIEAARALDLSTGHIMLREILPNMMSYVLVNFIFGVTDAMYSQVALVFFGLVPLGTNWGIMIKRANDIGAIFSPQTVWFMLAPIIAVSLFQLALVTFARSLEEVFNPRLRSGV